MAHVTCMARLLSRPTLDCFQINRHVFISLCLILLLFLKITMHMLQLSIRLSGGLHKIKKWVLSMSKKDEMVDNAPRRLCKYHPHLNGADFCGEGTIIVISGLLVDRFGSWFGMNKKLLHGVMCPISTPNDYLNTVFDDAVSLHGSCKTMLSHGSTGKMSTCCRSTEYTCFTFEGRGWVIYRIKKKL